MADVDSFERIAQEMMNTARFKGDNLLYEWAKRMRDLLEESDSDGHAELARAIDKAKTLTAQGGEAWQVLKDDGTHSFFTMSRTEAEDYKHGLGRTVIPCTIAPTPPAPSSSAVAGLVGKWEQRAETAKNRGELVTFHIAHAYASELKDALAATAASGPDARYFASGPEGSFFTDSLDFARAITRKSNHPDDWTVTDLLAAASAQGGGDG